MGSFSAVINFRTPLSSRWRYTSYHFFSDNYSLSNRSRIKIGLRFFKSRVFFKLGVYISHFVFSSIQYVSFLDIHFDRKFIKFRKKLARRRILENFIITLPKFSAEANIVTSSKIWDSKVFYFPFAASVKRARKFMRLRINTSCYKIFFSRPGIYPTFIKVLRQKNNCLSFAHKLFRIEDKLGFRLLFMPKKKNQFSKRSGVRPIIGKGKKFNQKITYPSSYQSNTNFSNFYLTFVIFMNISLEAWENSVVCSSPSNRKYISSNIENNRVGNNNGGAYISNFTRSEFFSVKDQFYIRLMRAFSFFSTYYFRFDPIRFVKIYKYSSFFNLKNYRKIEASSSFTYAGYRRKWLKFGYKNISKWFLKKYYWSIRSSAFFCSTRNLQINSYSRRFGKMGNLLEPAFNNLTNFTSISAGLISLVFSKRLRMRERVNPVLYSLMRLVTSRKKVRGLVIARNGRFTKRQRTLRSTLRIGKVPFNSYVMPIDYGFSTAILKYSIVSIKVWISSVPSARFFSNGLEMSSGFSYPSSLINFRIFERLYIKKMFKLVNSMIPVTFISPVIKLFAKYNYFKFSVKFTSSWNFGYFRAYRRFSKFYLFSKAKYLARIKKNSVV